jgi:hypothetical protein
MPLCIATCQVRGGERSISMFQRGTMDSRTNPNEGTVYAGQACIWVKLKVIEGTCKNMECD